MATLTGAQVGPMTLGALFAGIVDVSACPQRDLRISGVFDDSRAVRQGGLFVAVRGSSDDGGRFIPDAIRAGAAVIVSKDNACDERVVHVRVDDPCDTRARLAQRWYGLDGAAASDMRLLAITGTNGKSTTGYLTRAIVNEAGIRCGLLSTIEYDVCGRKLPATLTTPGPLQLASLLRECVDNGAGAVVMEASSHALDQRRMAGLRPDAAAFTNLTQDHLDYHATLDEYAEAKARLFDQLADGGAAVLNVDDPHATTMRAHAPDRVITYAMDQPADVTARVSRESTDGMRVRLSVASETIEVSSALIGRHNVYNMLAAAGLAHALDVSLEQIARGLTAVDVVRGRLERVRGIEGFGVVVDYAHTPAALEAVCRTLRLLVDRRLIVVFGCGGDRDREKRPLMGQSAARHAHAVIVTSDNPRSESPGAIIDDIIAGCDQKTRQRMLVEPDRRRAIEAAIAAAQPGDLVLVAGKGHEDYQWTGTERQPFDDVAVVREVAQELGAVRPEEDAGP
jgi:UDP-N-acetylmuramoyl-L-alanyl-D-glutamate--2,6-diaminopimelate ligase